MNKFENLIPARQLSFTKSNRETSEMLPRILEDLKNIPESGAQDGDPNPTVYAHYFYGASDWYITEYSEEDECFFGFVILNGWTDSAEFGYMSVQELTAPEMPVELNYYFTPKPLNDCLAKKGLKLVDWRLVETKAS